jgi:hypothetical protein
VSTPTRPLITSGFRGQWLVTDLYHKDNILLEGDHARRATALIMPKVNGQRSAKVQTAVRHRTFATRNACFNQSQTTCRVLNPRYGYTSPSGEETKKPVVGIWTVFETRLPSNGGQRGE